jgi:hypothetical protein
VADAADTGEAPDTGGVADAAGTAGADDAADVAAAAGGPADGGGVVGVGVSGVPRWRAQAAGVLPPVKLLVRAQLETLGQLPAAVLTHLAGGQLKLSSPAARYLLDEQGAQLRLVVIDQGQVVGVGRQTRVAPGWLADAIAAVHDTCTEPLCDRPARQADLDHATPWWPDGPDQPYGTTDTDNLGPLCGLTNQTPGRGGWQATQTGDGRRVWTHPRTGLTITTVPTTWRPPGWRPPCHHPSCHHPPGHHHRPADQARAPDETAPPDRTGPPDGESAGESGGGDGWSDVHRSEQTYQRLAELHGLPPRPPQPPPPDPHDLPF